MIYVDLHLLLDLSYVQVTISNLDLEGSWNRGRTLRRYVIICEVTLKCVPIIKFQLPKSIRPQFVNHSAIFITVCIFFQAIGAWEGINVEASWNDASILGGKVPFKPAVFGSPSKSSTIFGGDFACPSEFAVYEMAFEEVSILGDLLTYAVPFAVFGLPFICVIFSIQ